MFSSRSRRPQRSRFLKNIFSLVFVLGVVTLVIGIITPRIIVPREVNIRGIENLKKEELESSVKEFLKTPFFFSSKKLIASLKTSFPRIAEVDVRRNFFQKTLHLEVQERKPWALWCPETEPNKIETTCFYIDNSGIVFQKAPVFFGDLILKIFDERDMMVKMGKPFLETEYVINLQNFIVRLNDTYKTRTIEIKITLDLAFWLTTTEGWRIVLDSETDIDRALENLDIFLTSVIKDQIENLDYLDLRFKNKGFYKLR
ncbi:FtsQ-type POTRA domain-containing protein [Patescibacteria group bacterium]|nr:FtsQ-type POTRA domain-containing protein [Patescibacteria group bacterium]